MHVTQQGPIQCTRNGQQLGSWTFSGITVPPENLGNEAAHLRRSVGQCLHLKDQAGGVGLRLAEGTAEIGDDHLWARPRTGVVGLPEQDVLRLQVRVHHSAGVQHCHRPLRFKVCTNTTAAISESDGLTWCTAAHCRPPITCRASSQHAASTHQRQAPEMMPLSCLIGGNHPQLMVCGPLQWRPDFGRLTSSWYAMLRRLLRRVYGTRVAERER